LLSVGAAPQTLLGSLQRSPNPLAVLKRPTSKGRDGKESKQEGEGKIGKGRGGGVIWPTQNFWLDAPYGLEQRSWRAYDYTVNDEEDNYCNEINQ